MLSIVFQNKNGPLRQTRYVRRYQYSYLYHFSFTNFCLHFQIKRLWYCLWIRSIQMRWYLLQRGDLLYPQILCNNFSNQHHHWFSQATTQVSAMRSCFTLCRESHSVMHVLSNATPIWMRAQSEFLMKWNFRKKISFFYVCFFFSRRPTSKTASYQNQHIFSLVKAFMEKMLNLESDFQRYGSSCNGSLKR